MGHHGSVTRLIYDLRSDDSAVRAEAARLIWQRYFHGLLELAALQPRQASSSPHRRRGCGPEHVQELLLATAARGVRVIRS